MSLPSLATTGWNPVPRVRAGQVPQPMFVIWPENSSDIDPLANADAAQLISRAADAIDAPILVGGVVA